MDSASLRVGSEEIGFNIKPYGIIPPPRELIEWWNSLAWWQKLLIMVTGVVTVAGATYVVTKRK